MAKSWLDKIASSGALVTIVVALIGQAVFSIVWQVRYNEQQAAKIEAAALAIRTLRSEIVNLQTPLSALVLKMEGRVAGLETQLTHMEKDITIRDEKITNRLDSIDKGGTRELSSVIALITRLGGQTDRTSERLTTIERTLSEVQGQFNLVNNNLKNIDDRMTTLHAPRSK